MENVGLCTYVYLVCGPIVYRVECNVSSVYTAFSYFDFLASLAAHCATIALRQKAAPSKNLEY